jgi:Spy/CpxP family protein refolding chaperone
MKSYNRGTIIGALIGGAFGLALTIGAVAFASPHGPHSKGHRWTPERMEQHLSEMTERLSLSTAQEAQIRTIFEQARSRAQEIKEMPSGPEKFTAFRDLRFETEDQIYANLSCAQREELRLLKREHKAKRMQERWERHKADDPK